MEDNMVRLANECILKGCQHLYKNGEMKDNLRHISEEQAFAEGYTPCSVCGG